MYTFGGRTTVANSTFSSNRAGQGGGGLYSDVGDITVTNSTISFNRAAQGGGIGRGLSGLVQVGNSIVAGNFALGGTEEASGFVAPIGPNLVGQNGNAGGFSGGIVLQEAIENAIAPLGNYGGPTQTHALLPGSPAIDAAGAGTPATDQRGIARVGAAADIGAFESRGFTVTPNAPQNTIVNTTFSTPLTATVSSAFGEPVAGGTLTYTTPATGASAILSRNTTTLNSFGQASVMATANTIAGSYTVAAGGNGIAIPANFSLTNAPAAASRFSLTGFPSPTTAGESQPFTVTAFDTFGNLATNYTGIISFSSNDAQAVLPGLSSLTNGAGSFTGELRTAGVRSLTATDTTSPTLTGTQANIIVNPAAASQFLVTNFPSPTTAGVSQSFSVSAFDPFNNLATGYIGKINFTSNDAQAVLPGLSTLTAGTGTFTGELRTAGVRSVTATDTTTSTLTGTQGNIIVNPAATSVFSVAGFPSPTTAGAAQTFTVTAQDAFGNTTPNYTGSIGFSSNDAQAVLPGLSTLAAGTGTFTSELRTAGTRSLTATDTTSPTLTGTQANIIVNPAAASQFLVTNFPSPTTAGVSQTFSVSAFDPFNNLATGYIGKINFTSNDAQAVLPGLSTLTAGTGTFTGELRTAGVRSVTATDTTTSFLTGTQADIIVNPAAPASITSIAGTPQSTLVNTPFANSLQVKVTDAFGNPVSNTSVTFTAPVTRASGRFSGSTTVTTNQQGIATAPPLAANGIAGTYRIVGSVDGMVLTTFNLTNELGVTPEPPIKPTSKPTPQTLPLPDWEGKPPQYLEVNWAKDAAPLLCAIRTRQPEKFDEYQGLSECPNRPAESIAK